MAANPKDPYAGYEDVTNATPVAVKPAADPNDPYAKYEDADTAPKVGLLESFGRGALDEATFGFDDELGLQDKAKREAAREANPWTYFAGQLAGGVAPMVVAAPVAGAIKGTGLAARGARAALGLLNPAEKIDTVGRAALTGAKVGTAYGTLSGAGHADVEPTDSLGDAAFKRIAGGVGGATAGAVLGPLAGVGGYGVGKAIGELANRTMPSLQDMRNAAATQGLQGLRDIVRAAGYDNIGPEQLIALQRDLTDPAKAHIYDGLNIVEALQMGPLRELRPGQYTMEGRVTPNLDDLVKDAANVEGAGRQAAVKAFVDRRKMEADNLMGDVTDNFAPGQASAVGMRTAFDAEGALTNAERLPALIDAATGSGNPQAAQEAREAAKRALSRRYDNMRDAATEETPLISTRSLGIDQAANPVLDDAVRFALSNDAIRLAQQPGMDTAGGALYQAAQGRVGNEIVTLSPENIFDIHSYLAKLARVPFGQPATKESMMAGQAKDWFSAIVDRTFRGHQRLRQDYAAFKRMGEAEEMGQAAGTFGAKRTSDPIRFIEKANADLERATTRTTQVLDQYDAAVQRMEAGQRTTRPDEILTRWRNAERQREQAEAVVNAFRREWGENLKEQLARAGDDASTISLLKPMLTRDGQGRIRMIAGDERGGALIQELRVMEARAQGKTLGLKSGGDDAPQMRVFDRAMAEAQRGDQGAQEVVEAFRYGWAQRIHNEIAERAKMNGAGIKGVVEDMLTPAGQNRITQILGPERGKKFIETLVNYQAKESQSARLFGGPDTAYKLARNQRANAVGDAVMAIMNWRPMALWNATHDIARNTHKVARSNQANAMLAKQGRDEVRKIVDAVLARQQLALTGTRYTMPVTGRAVGPLVATVPGQVTPLTGSEKKRQP